MLICCSVVEASGGRVFHAQFTPHQNVNNTTPTERVDGMIHFTKKSLTRRAMLIFLLSGIGTAGYSANFSENFTFQGRLLENGVPVTDTVDFDLSIYDAASAGTQKGTTYSVSRQVVDGLFTIELSNVGTTISTGDGEQYYVEVVADDVTLGRMKITAAPYAVNAMNALNAVEKTGDTMTGNLTIDSGSFTVSTDKFIVTSSGVGIGTSTPSSTHSLDIQETISSVNMGAGGLVAGFTGDADGVELDGGMYPNGTNHTARSTTASRVACSAGDISFHTDSGLTVDGTFTPTLRMTVLSDGKVGVGNVTPLAPLHISNGSLGQVRIDAGSADTVGTLAVVDCGDANNSPATMLMSNVQYDGAGVYSRISSTKNGVMLSLDTLSGATNGIKGFNLTTSDVGKLLFHAESDGDFHLFEYDDQSSAKLKVTDGELYAVDSSSNVTQLSSHASPQRVRANASTSFDNQNIELPWSLHHRNRVVGKGAVVDMAKALDFIEDMMQAQLGTDEGQLFFDYDLSQDEVQSVDDHIAEAVDLLIERRLSTKPWTEVDLGTSDVVPADAVERVEIMEIQRVEEIYIDHEIDFNTNQIVEVEKTRRVDQEVGTGEYKKQLTADYCLKDGKLLRRTTVDDLNLSSGDVPGLPDWVLQRAAQPAQSSLQQVIDNQLSLGIQRAKLRDLAQKSAPLTVKSENKETAMAD
jgi:hypothetical protein